MPRPILPHLVADLPVALPPELATRLAAAFDVESKIPHALEALGPVAGADVVHVSAGAGPRTCIAADLGARVTEVTPTGLANLPPSSADVVLGCWTWFRDDLAADLLAAERVLRPGGRLLVLHDYGRDDVSGLRSAELPEYTTWGRRDGWFLRTGFKVRVIHCWWTFASLEEAAAFLDEAFGEPGRTVAAGLKRPRLSYNVAIYHRAKGDAPAE